MARVFFLHVAASLLLALTVRGDNDLCVLDHSNQEWMCNDCATSVACQETYSIVSDQVCTYDDLSRFTTLYNLLLQRVPVSETHRYEFTGNASCTLGATIAMSLSGVYGNVCASNEKPQLNAAETHIFCMCKDSYCDVEYTDTILNVLLSCLIGLLTLYLTLSAVYMFLSPSVRDNNQRPPTSTTLDNNTVRSDRLWTRPRLNAGKGI